VRVPLEWLGEFVTWTGSVDALADRLTMAGLEVAGVEEVGRLDGRIHAGRLAAVEPHPGAEHLRVCRLELGGDTSAVVVSGAPNLAPGDVVPVALAGATLPGGEQVTAAELRGVRSEGVLCSEAELALGEDAAGVLVLPAEVAPGTPLVDLPGVHDWVLELEITPNRGDCLSILGVAREVAALGGLRLRHPRPRPRETGPPAARDVRVEITAFDLCPRYCARVVRNVRIGPSPFPLRLRLRRAGMRPINAVVDASNHVMLERGQPLHAFDLARIAEGRIIVRRAARGERLVALDGIERVLDAADLVIADARGAVALAGVMGGQDSEVRPTTQAVLLESAFFAPEAVRGTVRRTGLGSEASYRFERRVDPAMVPEALDVLAGLIARLAGGEVAPRIVEQPPGARDAVAPAIRLRPRRAAAVLGMPLPRGEVGRRLRALGARWRPRGDAFLVTPPSYRSDLQQEEDLIEEIARFGGYDAIPVTVPVAPLTSGEEDAARAFARRVRRLLVAEGLTEMVTLAFVDPDSNRRLPGFVGAGLTPLPVRNPLSAELSELRRTPLAGLLRALDLNRDAQASAVAAFEIGKGYGLDAEGAPREPRAVALLLTGTWPPRGVEREGPRIDFLDLKGVCTNLFAGLGIAEERVSWQPAGEVGFLHPGQAALVAIDGTSVGVAGALHPGISQARDLAGEVWLAELDFTNLAHYVPRRVSLHPIAKFPAVTRDIAVIVDEAFQAGQIIEEVRAVGESQIESVRLFDCYRGAPVPPGKKSLAYTIAYRAADRTLTDTEVNALHAALRARLAGRFRLEFRE
jgi:phenylalanyl-tRNA synthetase beta chain